jgi:Leucine-rich repeat (LRR) protein
MNTHKLTALPAIPLPRLTKLHLSGGEITTCATFEGHPNLRHLDLSNNKIASLAGLANMPKLESLVLTQNEIADFPQGALTNMQSLTVLQLGKNKIVSLDGFPRLPSLEILSLTENQIADIKQLDHLKPNTKLRSLEMQENPIATEKADGFKLEVLIRLHDTNTNLKQLNGAEEPLTEEDFKNA